MRPRSEWLLVVALGACQPAGPSEEGDAGAPPRVETGLLGCPSGEVCTFVAVSQSLDDRIELFGVRGESDTGESAASYRGGLDLDLKPNPGGDIRGEHLDEPYGLSWDGSALHVVLGHYPTRTVGSLLSVPARGLADDALGALVPLAEWFDAGETLGARGMQLRALDREEPIALLPHPSGALLISVFANDLGLPDSEWSNPSELLSVAAPASPGPATITSGAVSCVGAWSLVALDADADTLALACDGDETLVLLDASPLHTGGAPEALCTGAIPFTAKRVRYLAPDGLGGVLVIEHPLLVSASEVARAWWFDGACALRGVSDLPGALAWSTRELIPAPGPAPRWLLARSDQAEPGVVVLAGDPATGGVQPCGRLDELDAAGAWTALDDTPLSPFALALSEDGRGLALTTAPSAYEDAGPGYGSVWWAELDYDEDICAALAPGPVELGALAPVDPSAPATWRRGPENIELIEIPAD